MEHEKGLKSRLCGVLLQNSNKGEGIIRPLFMYFNIKLQLACFPCPLNWTSYPDLFFEVKLSIVALFNPATTPITNTNGIHAHFTLLLLLLRFQLGCFLFLRLFHVPYPIFSVLLFHLPLFPFLFLPYTKFPLLFFPLQVRLLIIS